ncbi:MAG: AMP-binding protein [Solirubrobacterales bacterium]
MTLLDPRHAIRGAGRAGSRAAVELHGLGQVVRAGLVRPDPPRRAAAILRSLRRYGMLGGSVTAAALRHGERVGLVDELGELTFAELDRRSNALANAWLERGIRPEAKIAILCRNHRGFLDATLASAKLGARAVYLNTDFAGPQIADVCAREMTEALVHDGEFADFVAGAAARRGRFCAWADRPQDAPTLEELIAEGDPGPPPPPPEHGSVVMLTSGTTGTPKGAPRPNPRSLEPLGALLSKVPFRRGEVTHVAPPMFHAFGFANAVLGLGLGSTLVTARRFDAESAVAAVAAKRATALIVVPVMLQRIVALGPEVLGRHDLSSLRIVFCGGAQLEGELARATREALGDVLYNLYGSTEVAYATIATPDDLRAAPGCAGRPPFGTTVRLYDDAGVPVTERGASGRIFVGNSFQFEGYTGGGTKEVIDGLMSTGDVGHFDGGGRLFIDGRDDEMIVSGGENVFPREVEELLVTHAEIEEAAAIGVPDEQFGQVLHAFIVRRPDGRLDEDGVRAFVRENLARYKIPRQVEFIDALPRNPSGKVLKRELAEARASRMG